MNTVCIAHGNCDYGPGMKLTELQGRLAQLGGGHRCTRNVQEASETAYASRHAHGHIKPWQMHNIARPCSCSMCCP